MVNQFGINIPYAEKKQKQNIQSPHLIVFIRFDLGRDTENSG